MSKRGKAICDICGGVFEPKSCNHVHCCPECAYVWKMIGMPAAEVFDTRAEAVAHYQRQYRIPYRRLGRTHLRPLLDAISDYCDANDTDLFAYHDLPEDVQERFHHNKLKTLANVRTRPIMETGERVPNSWGTWRAVQYRFLWWGEK